MISRERLASVLDYDPATGIFTWQVSTSNRQPAGAVAGGLSDDGYIVIRIDGKLYRAHRLVFLYMTGEMPSKHADHKNRIRTDNRWENLRHCSRSQNQSNRTKQYNNTSGFKGVTFDKQTGRWIAQIGVGGKNIKIGRFSTPEAAGKAYADAAEKHHRDFANHAFKT